MPAKFPYQNLKAFVTQAYIELLIMKKCFKMYYKIDIYKVNMFPKSITNLT